KEHPRGPSRRLIVGACLSSLTSARKSHGTIEKRPAFLNNERPNDILRAMAPVTVRTMCPMNCHPTLCGMLVDVDDGRLLGVRGDPDNPDSRGFLCIRGQASREIIGTPQRLLHPPIRAGRRDGEWRRASWDDALDLIVARMRNAGREAVGAWSGHGVFANTYRTRV